MHGRKLKRSHKLLSIKDMTMLSAQECLLHCARAGAHQIPMKIRLGLLSACAISVQLFAAFASAKDIYIAQNATGGATGADCSNARPASFFNTASNWGTGASRLAQAQWCICAAR